MIRTTLAAAVVAASAAWAAAPAEQDGTLHTENVTYRDGETVLEGYLVYDRTIEGKRPGVLVVHEWWGLNEYPKARARQLARMGYVAFAVDMYGKGVLATTAAEAGKLAGQLRGKDAIRTRAAAGLEVLRKQPRVDPKRIAAIGYCFGGTTVLELARSGADLAGVVSFHGGLGTHRQAEKGQVKAEVLVCHGAADPAVPDKELMAFVEEMRAAEVAWTLVMYSGAKHGFTNPDNAQRESNTVGYQKRADEASWAHMKVFFDRIFDRRPGPDRRRTVAD